MQKAVVHSVAWATCVFTTRMEMISVLLVASREKYIFITEGLYDRI